MSSHPGARGDRSWWDDGPHQRHAPRRGPDPLAVFIIVAALAVAVLALWRRS